MADWAKLIEAIAGLVGAVAWPVAVVLAVWLMMRRHRDAFGRLIDRVTTVSFPGGEIGLAEVEAEHRSRVDELVEQIAVSGAEDEQRRALAQELAEEANSLGALTFINHGSLVQVEDDPRTIENWENLARLIKKLRQTRRDQPPDSPTAASR